MKYRYDPDFHKELNEVSLPDFVYHVTNRRNLVSIFATGLKASKSIDGCKVAYVYTFTDLSDAKAYARGSGNRVILNIKTAGIPARVASHHDMGLMDAEKIIRFECNLRPDRLTLVA